MALHTREYWRNPYPVLKVLRDHYPIYHDPIRNVWYITRYDDVVEAFKDNEHFSNRIFKTFMGVVFGPTIMELDGEEHSRRRNIVAPEFAGKKLEAMLPIIERNTAALIAKFTEKNARKLAEGFADRGEVDLIDEFSTRLPVNVILDVLGLPQSDHDLFHEWYPAMMDGLTGNAQQREYGIYCNQQFHAYIDGLVDERSVNPGDDLISKLCVAEVDGHRMSKEDIKAFSSLLLVAGGETTDKAIANTWYHLLTNLEQFHEVERDPELFDRAFTEMMRITPPAGGQPRECVKDYAKHGTTIPAGAEVQLSIFGANHDERVFKDPDRFDIFRDDLYFGKELRAGYHEGGKASHLGFGLGKHFCVGYQLARAETVIGSKMLLQAMKNPRIKPGSNPQVQVAGPMNENPKLEIVFDPA
jgi:pulcherriminic acid synthase